MPEDRRKPLTALPGGIPPALRDFVRCRSDSVDIEPGDLDWLPHMSLLTLSFEEDAQGLITLRLTGLGGVINISIAVSVQGGRLVADTSDVPVPGDGASEWIDNFNADLQANGMQLSDASIRDGKLHFAKERIAVRAEGVTTAPAVTQPPLSPPPPPAHVTDPIPAPTTAVDGAGPEVDEYASDISIPHGDQAALQAPYSLGASPGVTRRWSKWRRVGAATAGGFVLAVAGFFLFVDDREEPPTTTPPLVQEDGATASSSPATSNTESPPTPADETEAPQTETPPPESTVEEPVSIGFDETGDQKDGNTSERIASGQEIPGGDITEVSHRMEADGTHTIMFQLAGDGMQFTEPGNAWYDVIVSAEDSTGGLWQANGAWFSGQYSDRGIRLGPVVSGREALPDGVVSIVFLEPDSFEMNIDGGGEPLDLSMFTATIGVSADGETRWDSALGAAGNP